ncbi:MAG: CapA family protein [bacterium]|nr:CapA family protein [bacterium]
MQETPRLITAALVALLASGLASCSSDVLVDPAMGETSLVPLPPVATTSPRTTLPTATTEPPVPEKGWLTIQGVGDSNFDPSYIPNLATEGYEYAFEALDGLLVADDLTVMNLECASSNLGSKQPYAFNFRCDPAALPVLAANGVDVANLANNHGMDYGVEAMLDSKLNVAAAGIAPVGVGSDVEEAISPAIVDVNGWRVAVLGMNGVVVHGGWLATDDDPGMASGDDTAQMVRAVTAAAEIADIVVVSIHWLFELEAEPRPDDRARAVVMIEAGADVIFGHHPHRLGELEFIEGKPVFWTLGNFVWPRLSHAGATTAIGRVLVAPDGTIDACMIPAFIENSGQPALVGAAPCVQG